MKYVEVDCEVLKQTAKAYYIDDGKTQCWIPKSQIEDYCEDRSGKITSIFIPQFIANENGLI